MPGLSSRNTFRKAEKLCSQIQIDKLFSEGKSFTSGNFRLIYLESEASEYAPVQVLIAVPKKQQRFAVHRNRMKRLMRESYRLSKHRLLDKYIIEGKHCDLAFVFNSKKIATQTETFTAINALLDRLILTHEKNSE